MTNNKVEFYRDSHFADLGEIPISHFPTFL